MNQPFSRHQTPGAPRVWAGLLACVLAWGPGRAGVPAGEYHAAVKELVRSEKELDAAGFVEAFTTVLRMDDARALRTAVKAYSTFAPVVLEKLGARTFIWFHGKAAGAFRAVKSAGSVKQLRRDAQRHKSWHVRLLLLNAAVFAKPVKLLDSCLAALQDRSPIVVRRALYYLRRARTVEVVERLIRSWIAAAAKHPSSSKRSPEALQWERTLLAYQSALREMLKVGLATPEDYRNYLQSHGNDPYLFDPGKRTGDSATGLTLFGAAVTGKNIIFILDTSGSMRTTDPRPPGSLADGRGRGQTRVGAPSNEEVALRARERERMYRAKRELSRVVRALPYDVQFNIIDFSSDVRSWKRSMVPAKGENKKSAVKYVEGMKAEGITVTDMAVEEAFSDLSVDTIYLVTDGAPTHVGGSTRGKPRDADQLIAEILQRVKELNYLRGVRVFTLGFKGAEEDFLKKLAKNNAGQYVAIR